jgi:hypothetical protein
MKISEWEVELTEFMNMLIAHLNQAENDIHILKTRQKISVEKIGRLHKRIEKLQREAIWKN